ncbi:hypothetical protein [Clostridium algidicarnis]|uniref:hypothetical protein n=1 Tax=Clostridium algidicarnis TaxID=37659 RepID=UPI001C0E6454|nr:hypothetical protein [Clostridium algidicarnis]MBU3197104.1 hypothetical protein [Clostridium algidicarnis]MBU3228535.1 hypothetical protein [Clostridium algidicarnis]MBU3251988.1 hypothetical protein [Clostridium algidicarnis]
MRRLNVDGKDVVRIGRYTRNAVKSFENNIVQEVDYLEKINKNSTFEGKSDNNVK